jgi:UDP-GlcNAc:undecaprenyl-phosphate/decaprenyl-phosphate GlcNAc-1-phosphate transferase
MAQLAALILLGGLISFALSGAVVWLARSHGLGIKRPANVQRIHSGQVPRLGGIPVFVALSVVCWFPPLRVPGGAAVLPEMLWLILPVFGVGLIEDLTARMSAQLRLLVTVLAAAIIACCGLTLMSLQVAPLDAMLHASLLATIVFTAIAVAGVAHAINIVDGCNGLAGFTVMAAFCGLGVIANYVGDHEIARICWLSIGAVGGFLLWNFPRGLIFLGDAGAYMLGFLIATLSISLLLRHPQISPWFPLLLVIYPVWETLFSMWRRSRIRLAQIMRPDAEHLHHYLYKFFSTQLIGLHLTNRRLVANSMSSVPFAIWALLAVVLGIRDFDNRSALQLHCLGFIVVYCVAYRVFKVRRRPRKPAAGGFALGARGAVLSARTASTFSVDIASDIPEPGKAADAGEQPS